MRTAVLSAALGVLVCAVAVAQERPRERAVPVIMEWKGGSVEKKDEKAWKVAPDSGVISDAATWAAVWKAWNGDRVGVPGVDFGKEVVLVAAAEGQNDFTVAPLKLDDKGDLVFKYKVDGRGGTGFTFTALKIKNDGIRTVNGKDVRIKD